MSQGCRNHRPACRAKVAQNYIDPEHIEKIVQAYRAFEEVDRFAHVADRSEIEGKVLTVSTLYLGIGTSRLTSMFGGMQVSPSFGWTR